MATEGLIDIETVAKRLGVSKGTVRALVKEGELRAIKIRRQLRFSPADVEAFVTSRVVQPKKEDKPS